MKLIISLLLFINLTTHLSAQTFTEVIVPEFIPLADARIEWGDFDKDGDMDLLASGKENNSRSIVKIYKNAVLFFLNLDFYFLIRL